ncbi:MAG: CoA transferase [Planctomycetota bacterium]|nr:CoA transferase [Planctomycetota bacterium]
MAVGSDDEWGRLCTEIGRPELARDPRFATHAARKQHEQALDEAISAWTCERDAWQAMHVLQAAGVMAGVVEDLEDMVVRDPHLSVLHFARVPDAEQYATYTTHNQPMRFDGETPPLRRAPLFGEHNEYVFREVLGLSEKRYIELLVGSVIY